MNFSDSFKESLFSTNTLTFDQKALTVFDYQFRNNSIYRAYCENFNKNPDNVKALIEIPFLPISFFKHQDIKSGSWKPEKVFLSSGTGGQQRSKHLVKDLTFYQKVVEKTFEVFYGYLGFYQIGALLPSYQQQGDSSLIYMVDHFMKKSKLPSGYFLDNLKELSIFLESRSPKILIGVSYALLEYIQQYQHKDLTENFIMETGGMKGRKKEMVREELHQQLMDGFGVNGIHSEYGMTELFSQAYAYKNGVFKFPPWCRVLIREINDPFKFVDGKRNGGINVIDLANVDTCSFIETQDLGQQLEGNSFKVLGRFDNSDIRGCNLLVH
jgi:hypothetical protein